MESTLTDLKERRAIKKYKKDQISEKELDAVLEAGTYAPTGMNRQSPLIIAIQDPETIKKLSAMNAAVMGIQGDPFYGAPTVVVVLGDKTVSTYKEDASLVMGNLMNAAHAIGLGSCWIHRAKEVFESPEGRALLESWHIKDPERYEGVGHCILGYADEVRTAKPRKEGYIIKIK